MWAQASSDPTSRPCPCPPPAPLNWPAPPPSTHLFADTLSCRLQKLQGGALHDGLDGTVAATQGRRTVGCGQAWRIAVASGGGVAPMV